MRTLLLKPSTRRAFVVLGVIAVVVALMADSDRVAKSLTVGPLRLSLALLLMTVANLSAAFAWSSIMEEECSRQVLVFLSTLPARYLPGGVGQPLAQMSQASSTPDEVGVVGTRMIQHMLLTVGSAGTLVFLGSVFNDEAAGWWVAGLAAMLVGFASMQPTVIAWVWGRLLRRPHTLQLAQIRRLWLGSGFTVLGLSAMTLAFVVLVGSDGTTFPRVGIGFLASWLVGFAALPVPGGLGIREAVLSLLLPLPAAAVLTGSLIHRAVGAVSDLTLGLVGSLLLGRARRRALLLADTPAGESVDQ